MKRVNLLMFLLLFILLHPLALSALGKPYSKAENKAEQKKLLKLLQKDKARDKATTPRPLEKETKVRRFVRNKQDLQKDIPANSHMTGPIHAGRVFSRERAKNAYGLPKQPRYVGTIRLEKDMLIRKNKALGGKRGREEYTSPQKVKKNQVINIMKMSR